MNGLELARRLLNKKIQIIPLDGRKHPKVKFANLDITNGFINHHEVMYSNSSCFGVLTRGIWCIDIDRNHDGGEDGSRSLKKLAVYSELANNFRQTMIQTTPSGGIHAIFRKRQNIHYSQKIGYLPGIDIKANNNNYFVLAGSQTAKGVYKRNKRVPIAYEGDFEKRIFETPGNYEQQFIDKHSIKYILNDYDFSHIPTSGNGKGKQAYERITQGTSIDRNEDLYLALNYARTCNVSVEPLRVLIGTVKQADVFTEQEFNKTVKGVFQGFNPTNPYHITIN